MANFVGLAFCVKVFFYQIIRSFLPPGGVIHDLVVIIYGCVFLSLAFDESLSRIVVNYSL